jgi:hypothetical protein
VLVFCWLVIALMRDPGHGPLQGLHAYLPAPLHYWPTRRRGRSGPWEGQAVRTDRATATRRSRPPPADGVLSLRGDRTLKPQRGRKPPVGPSPRPSGQAPDDRFGCAVVRGIARWERGRVPSALGLRDPQRRGHQHSLFRQLVKAVVPPPGGQHLGGGADAGSAAHETLRLRAAQPYADVCARPRTRQFPNGTPLRAWGHHLPPRCSSRRASHSPAGHRQDAWGVTRRAPLHPLGDGTIVLSPPRRNDGPKGVQIIVTHLPAASAGTILRLSARRGGGARTSTARNSGLPLGQLQVPTARARVGRSVVLSGRAERLLVRL